MLEGSVQKAGDRLRATASLIRVADGTSLWADTFDEKFTDVFSVQDTISQKVADALALRLSGEEKERLAKRYTKDVDAYQLYLTGRYHWNKLTPPEIKTSLGFFQQAIDKDPGYALAYFGLAEANRSLAINADVPSQDCLPRRKRQRSTRWSSMIHCPKLMPLSPFALSGLIGTGPQLKQRRGAPSLLITTRPSRITLTRTFCPISAGTTRLWLRLRGRGSLIRCFCSPALWKECFCTMPAGMPKRK